MVVTEFQMISGAFYIRSEEEVDETQIAVKNAGNLNSIFMGYKPVNQRFLQPTNDNSPTT